jgi:recombination associated protein RdgC
MFKNATILKLAQLPTLAALTACAEAAKFAPCGPTQPFSIGFVPPRQSGGAMAESIGNQWILKAIIETKSVPASEVKKRVAEMASVIERETGRTPSKKHRREIAEQVILELLPAAFPKQAAVLIWVDPSLGRMVLDTASASRSDDVCTLMAKTVPGLQIQWAQTAQNPETVCRNWLHDGQTHTDEFILGRSAETRATDESKAALRYTNHALDTDEIKEHIRSGHTVKRLALGWNGRVGFALDPGAFVIRRIEFEDVVFESRMDADTFDADVAILTGELGPLLEDMAFAFGGWATEEGGQA